MRTATRDYTTTFGRARIAVSGDADSGKVNATIVVHRADTEQLYGHERQGAHARGEPMLFTIEQARALVDLLNGALHAAIMDSADIQLGKPLSFDHLRPITCAQVAVSLDPEQSDDQR